MAVHKNLLLLLAAQADSQSAFLPTSTLDYESSASMLIKLNGYKNSKESAGCWSGIGKCGVVEDATRHSPVPEPLHLAIDMEVKSEQP